MDVKTQLDKFTDEICKPEFLFIIPWRRKIFQKQAFLYFLLNVKIKFVNISHEWSSSLAILVPLVPVLLLNV